jgi:hypothetical protein
MLDDVLVSGDSVIVKGLEVSLQDRSDKGLVQFQGDLRARHCGRVARKEQDRPQEKLKLSIGREPITVRGASLHPEGKSHYLRLTRAPHACDSAFTEGYDFYLDLALVGDPPKLKLGALLGDVFPDTASGSKGKEAFDVKTDSPLSGTGELRVTLKGALELGGYRVVLDGEVNALRCQKK